VKREDRRAGEVVAIVYNANRDTDKDPNGIDWRDVFPEWKEQPKEEPEEQTEDEMFEMMQRLVKLTEGRSG
jgi:hypothetical protein